MRYSRIYWLVSRNRLLCVIGVIVLYITFFNIYVIYMNKSDPKIRKYKTKNYSHSINNKLLEIQGNFSFNTPEGPLSLFPWEEHGNLSDRIVNQMRLVPHGYNETDDKIIFFENGKTGDYDLSICPVKKCIITNDYYHILEADLIILRSLDLERLRFHQSQIVGIFSLESPENFNIFPDGKKLVFNWTISYRYDATIVAPYFKFTPYDLRKPLPERYPFPKEDFSVNRTKEIAWFVSNCYAKNGRIRLGNILSHYFKIDIYGICGPLKCSKLLEERCFKELRNYMFYLSFENSNCRHYITEKLFRNALNYSVIPIVMGAHPDDYKLVAPPHSYIHVEDFSSIGYLVKYLKYLMKNKTAYNEYFAWKEYGKLDTNTFFMCRLCTMAHYSDFKKQIDGSYMKDWWNINKTCTKRTWKIKPFW